MVRGIGHESSGCHWGHGSEKDGVGVIGIHESEDVHTDRLGLESVLARTVESLIDSSFWLVQYHQFRSV